MSHVIYGKNPVIEALNAEACIDTVYILKETTGFAKIIALAKDQGIPIKEVTIQKLNSLIENDLDEEADKSPKKHGGVVAVIAATSYKTVEEILSTAKEKGKPPFIIIADEIEDPHNLGALIRTAEAAGADGIIIPKRRSAGLTSTTMKTSAGAASHIKVARVSNLVDTIKQLKKVGIWIYGAEADGVPYYKTDFSGAIAIVIGSEGSGLSRLVRENCDHIVSIDMYGNVNSLNASVSGAILMYEVVKYRR